MAQVNNRVPVKWIRDCAKSAYKKADKCHICASTENLELHHYASMSNLLERWVRKTGYDVSTDDAIKAVREEFIKDHHKEIYEDVVTLCKKHHLLLHNIYGGKPNLATAPKQANWVEKQKEKHGIKVLDSREA